MTPRAPDWLQRESATLALLYPAAPWRDILRALPARTQDACRIHAKRTGIRRTQWTYTAGHHRGWTPAQARRWSAIGGAANAARSSRPRYDLAGLRFGRLVVQRYIGRKWWECRCDCGETAYVVGSHLRRPEHPVRSCGCLRREVSRETMRRMRRAG